MPETDLADLHAFVAVARSRSFRGAAALRRVSASSLSEAVRRLEAQIGVRLLNRTTRSVTPTDAGARLLDRVAPALVEVAAALGAVGGSDDSPAGILRLNVPVVVARVILPSLIGRFLPRFPGITLDITAEDTFIDMVGAGYDAGVRYDERLERDMIAIPIGPRVQRFVSAGAPAYFQARGRPSHPKDLLSHACIRHRFASGVMSAWEFQKNDELVRVSPSGPLIATSVELEVAAAVQGLGLIATFEEFLAPALAAGTLEPVLDDWSQSFPGPYLYYPSRRLMPAPLRAFVDFLKKEAALQARSDSLHDVREAGGKAAC